MKQKLIVIGNGMVGHRFCEKLAEFEGTEQFEVTVFGEERRPAYDRVHLSSFFETGTAEALALADPKWYAEHNIRLVTGNRVSSIDCEARSVVDSVGRSHSFDRLVLATGSAPFVPPMPGTDLSGVFVYRTIEDLEAIQAYAAGAQKAVVLGGGLLGLEAAKAALDLGLSTTVVEREGRLMPRQLDDEGAALLRSRIEELGVQVRLGRAPISLLGPEQVRAIDFEDGTQLPVDLVIISAGIRPRDELARSAGLRVGERGGVVVDAAMRTSDPDIFAIGEVALFENRIFGLVAPGYEMAECAALGLVGREATFSGGDLSTKLKLIGVDVASFGVALPTQPEVREVRFTHSGDRVYRKLVVSPDGKHLLGGILVGDAEDYGKLLQIQQNEIVLPANLGALMMPGAQGDSFKLELPDEAQICKCNNVRKGTITAAIREGGCSDLGSLKSCTNAGTGCGGCVPQMNDLLLAELKLQGRDTRQELCEHFPYTRQELFAIIKVQEHKTFSAVIRACGKGIGCEVCKPAVASILASLWNDLVARPEHAVIQDTNDRFLANIQKGGTYSVVPRIPGGEITPDQLIRIGEIAKEFDLYCKITGGQRIDLFGARVDQLPDIWEGLIEVGLESGHAYGKALRTVKSCVGSTWCRYGVQDSTSMAIRLEERYRGLRAPHKVKAAVSGCIRECAEAQSKDFGVIATEKGWNLYVAGNGGARPQHAVLLAEDLDDEALIRCIDRFLMYYVATADKLERTAWWFNRLEGGVEHLRDVILRDTLGLCAEFDRAMERHVATYHCEWSEVVRNPELRARFRHFANTDEPDASIRFERTRGQRIPVA